MKLKLPYFVRPGAPPRLSEISPANTDGYQSEQSAAPVLLKNIAALTKLQELLYAGRQKALLIVLQGMDGSGKDGTVRHIFSGVNPQSCNVTSFNVPTPLEARHDFLWRVHAAVPPRGNIGIFNRSHYEDVLSPVVHKLISPKAFRSRLNDINDFERILVDNDVVLLKFFLHISRDEQAHRLKTRLDDPEKHWKLDPADFRERTFWTHYMETYEQVLAATSTNHAPWYIVPADHKWYRNVTISSIIVEALQDLDLKYPSSSLDLSTLKL